MRRATAVLLLVLTLAFAASAGASSLTVTRARNAVTTFMRTAKAHTYAADVPAFDQRVLSCHRVSKQRVDCHVFYRFQQGFSESSCNTAVAARLHERQRPRRSWITTYFHGPKDCSSVPITHP
jgi:hypothetical protein